MKQLLEAGVHFGHQTSRWNPKMRPYIFGARQGIHITTFSRPSSFSGEACRLFIQQKRLPAGGNILFVRARRAGPGADQGRVGPLRTELRQRTLARRDPDELPDHQQSIERLKKNEEILADPGACAGFTACERLMMSAKATSCGQSAGIADMKRCHRARSS